MHESKIREANTCVGS